MLSANHNGGDRIHTFTYDLAGNRLEEDLSGTGVTDKLTEYEYNNANQISQMRVDGGSWTGFTYDNNGNLTDDGVNSYEWDRANRLLEVDTGTPAELTAYAYDGLSNRISQAIGTTSPVVTQYLLDTQPSLAKVIGATVGGNTDRYIHAPRGIHSVENSSGSWRYALQDGLGSVRAEVDNLGAVQASQSYAPYGEVFGASGTMSSPFAFTGEPLDGNGLQYHRARYYSPEMGVWASLDPLETGNRYAYVNGNPINFADPTGLQACPMGFQPDGNYGCEPIPTISSTASEWTFQASSQQSTGNCSQYTQSPTNAVQYALCLQNSGKNPCPRGMPLAYEGTGYPKCLLADGTSQLAAVLWEESWGISSTPPWEYYKPLGIAFITPILEDSRDAWYHAGYWSRVALGWEQLPEGVTRLQASAEAVFGLGNIASVGSLGEIRRGINECDPLRTILGAIGLFGFVKGVQAGHSVYGSLRNRLVNLTGRINPNIVGMGTFPIFRPSGSSTPRIVIDIGGEGRYTQNLGAINLNPMTVTSTTGEAGQQIPNLVQGFGQQLPFKSKSADVIIIESAPLPFATPDEVARVIKSGGQIYLSHPADYMSRVGWHQQIIDMFPGARVTQEVVLVETVEMLNTTVIVP